MLGNAQVAALLPTTDIEVSKDFYQNKLGLKLLPIEDGPVVFGAGAAPRSRFITVRSQAKPSTPLRRSELPISRLSSSSWKVTASCSRTTKAA